MTHFSTLSRLDRATLQKKIVPHFLLAQPPLVWVTPHFPCGCVEIESNTPFSPDASSHSLRAPEIARLEAGLEHYRVIVWAGRHVPSGHIFVACCSASVLPRDKCVRRTCVVHACMLSCSVILSHVTDQRVTSALFTVTTSPPLLNLMISSLRHDHHHHHHHP